NTDHKVIGIQYLVTTIFFFVAAGLLAMLMRAELARPGMQFVDNQTFNGLFSVHAALMIFLFVIPAFAGIGNYVIPLMIGAPDMAFPRLNALSFWLLPIAGFMMISSFLAPGGPFAAGWTGYAPLASTHHPLGYPHIFWFSSHPAVYFMMLPGFGIASEVISVMARKPIFGYRLMALSLMAILVLGFSVWAHHMFVAGMAPWLRVPMMVTSMVIAVPTGIKVFSWLA